MGVVARPRLMIIAERDLQQAVIEYAELRGWMVYHVANVHRQLRGRSSPGFPDLVLIRKGDGPVFVELKSAKGKLSDDQVRWKDTITGALGCSYYLWRPEHWQTGCIEEVLK